MEKALGSAERADETSMIASPSAIYSPGHPNLDRDHQLLFELLAKLQAADRDPTTLKGYDGEFRAYLDAHFEHEEELMDKHGYGLAGEHKEDHRRMREKAEGLAPIADEPEAARTALIATIQAWIEAHIWQDDARLSEFLQHCDVERVTGEPGLFSESE